MTARVFLHFFLFSGLTVNTRVFQKNSMCAIFFSIMLPFFNGIYVKHLKVQIA